MTPFEGICKDKEEEVITGEGGGASCFIWSVIVS
jgi:hypothetical protein